MRALERFRYWIAKPLLDALSDLHSVEIMRQYKQGYQDGLNLGQAVGQLQGQQHILSQMSGYLEERKSDDPPTQDDINRAKQGLIH